MAKGFLRPLPPFPSRGTPAPSHPCVVRKVVELKDMTEGRYDEDRKDELV